MDIDLDILFSNDFASPEDLEPVDELTQFQTKTLELLEESKSRLTELLSKTYKSSNGSVWVGGELEGGNYSFNYINYRRLEKEIIRTRIDIKVYTEDLIQSGYQF